jgi:hypothetical protein
MTSSSSSSSESQPSSKEQSGQAVSVPDSGQPPSSKDNGESSGEPATPQEASPLGDAPAAAASTTAWQAIWSPEYKAYYFYNAETQETTWSNPLQPPPQASDGDPSQSSPPSGYAGPSTASASPYSALQAAAEAAGIDPSLAHLDPTLASVPGATPGSYAFTARFNARTGTFAKPDARDPTHLSEYERAKRMSEFYFDVGAWEADVEKRKMDEAEEAEAGSSKKKKKLTKKDIVSAPPLS